jgi:hypothetical protein
MMEVRLARVAAPDRANEDYALAVGDLVAVFDGVTLREGIDSGCVHGPAWYVRRGEDTKRTPQCARPCRS